MTTPFFSLPVRKRWAVIGLIILGLALFVAITKFGGDLFYGKIYALGDSIGSFPWYGALGIALFGGVIGFFSPCAFSVFPAYLAYIMRTDNARRGSLNRQTIRFAGITSLGIVATFLVFGLILSIFGITLAQYASKAKLGIIALMAIFGLVMMFGASLPAGFLDRWRVRLSMRSRNASFAKQTFVYGVVYAFAAAACFLPFLISIALLPVLNGQLLLGFFSFVLYAAGVSGMLFLFTRLALAGANKFVGRMQKAGPNMKRIAGALLLFSAFYLLRFYILFGW